MMKQAQIEEEGVVIVPIIVLLQLVLLDANDAAAVFIFTTMDATVITRTRRANYLIFYGIIISYSISRLLMIR